MTLAQLLVVQAHDSAIDRLRHQRTSLPEFQALADCDAERTHLEAQRGDVDERRHVLGREQKRHEDEVAIIEDRRDKENERLYSGAVTAHKDLQAIQAELAVLAERQEGIEDQVLELMEKIEPVDNELAAIDAKLADIAERRAKIEAALTESQASIDAEIETEGVARNGAIAEVEADLVTEYERCRSELGGVGIARLNHKTCEGCHLQLSAVDYDRVRKAPTDTIAHCPECERILVRD